MYSNFRFSQSETLKAIRRFSKICFHYVQGSAKRWVLGLVTFVPVVANHFCLALSASFMQPVDHILTKPCRHRPHHNQHLKKLNHPYVDYLKSQ